jgi:hypothetical protein
MSGRIVIWLALAILLAARAAAAAPDEGSVAETFERGRTAFGRGEYQRAIELLRPLLYPEVRLETEGEIVQAHRMLGVAHLFENQPDDARKEFRKLLELRPDYRFDPLLDPPRVVDFFNGVVRDEERELLAMEAKRKKLEAELAARRLREAELQRARETVVVRTERHSYAVSFIPFGAGQFQNGQSGKGWLFLGAEGVLAAASIGTFVTNLALYGFAPRRRCLMVQPLDANLLPRACPADQIDHSQENVSNDLLRVQVATGALFWATAIWGVVDAVRHFKRDVPLPDEPPAAPKTTFRLTPTPFGLGAAWRF